MIIASQQDSFCICHDYDVDRSELVDKSISKSSLISFDGLSGVGQAYFGGLFRLTQLKFLIGLLFFEVLNFLSTIVQLLVFYHARDRLIHREAPMVEYELIYLVILNLLPISLMARTIILN